MENISFEISHINWNDYTLNIPKSFKKLNDNIIKLTLKEHINNNVNNDLSEYIIGVIEGYEDIDTILEDFSEHQALTLGRSYMKEAMNYLHNKQKLISKYKDHIEKAII
ncbi:hypothetical protein [Staphylococcus warneri]|uniref:hypothetical protein n=1 Tax=Staphylococcus warneri TaxID=1292 RepID=UPI0022E6EE23|nr:hypothetical protein [Staphylococcus warneri]